MKADSREIGLRVTLQRLATGLPSSAMRCYMEYLVSRANASFGFRGQVKKLRVVKREAKKES